VKVTAMMYEVFTFCSTHQQKRLFKTEEDSISLLTPTFRSLSYISQLKQ